MFQDPSTPAASPAGASPEPRAGARRRWLWRFGLGALGVLALSAFLFDTTGGDEPVAETGVEPAQQHPLIAVARAMRGPVTQWYVAQGLVESIDKRYLHIETGGIVVALGEDEDGQPLREGSAVHGPRPDGTPGQVLVRLDEREALARLAQTEAEHLRARRRVEMAQIAERRARHDHERATTLASRGLDSRQAAETASADWQSAVAELNGARADVDLADAQRRHAQIILDKTTLRAPFDGRLALVNVRVGDYVEGIAAGEPAARESTAAAVVIGEQGFEITLQVPWPEAQTLRPGQTVLASADAEAGWRVATTAAASPIVARGKLWSVSPSIGRRSRAVAVKVRTDGSTLKDGMLTTVWIAAASEGDALLIPRQALVAASERQSVFVYNPIDSKVEKRLLETGLGDEDHIAVRSGVREGELVVTAGHHLLADGMRAALGAAAVVAPDHAASGRQP